MEISVLGAGSIGLMFAAYFAENEHDVTVITRSKSQKDKICENGITLVKGNNKRIYKIKALTIDEYVEATSNQASDLLLVAVKQNHLKELESQLFELIGYFKHILFVQNGMGHLNLLQKMDHSSILIGVVEHGALKLAEHVAEHTGIARTRIAAYKGIISDRILEQLSVDDFPFKMETSWYEMLAEKLVINAVINPLTTIFRLKNGGILTNTHIQTLMKGLFNEAIEILELRNKNDLWNLVLNVCELTSENTSSMLRDIECMRQTEIDAISGYLLRNAKEKKKKIPYTEFVFHSIKGIEESLGEL